MLIHRCQGFFALTTFGTFLAGPVKSSIGFSFFCCSCICSACPSVLQVCLFAVQPGLLARLAMHLVMYPAIWLSCISIHLHIWQSGNLAVHSSASARICLPFCPAILFCQPVLQDVHLLLA